MLFGAAARDGDVTSMGRDCGLGGVTTEDVAGLVAAAIADMRAAVVDARCAAIESSSARIAMPTRHDAACHATPAAADVASSTDAFPPAVADAAVATTASYSVACPAAGRTATLAAANAGLACVRLVRAATRESELRRHRQLANAMQRMADSRCAARVLWSWAAWARAAVRARAARAAATAPAPARRVASPVGKLTAAAAVTSAASPTLSTSSQPAGGSSATPPGDVHRWLRGVA